MDKYDLEPLKMQILDVISLSQLFLPGAHLALQDKNE